MENAREFLVEIVRALAFAFGVPFLDTVLLMISHAHAKGEKSEGQHHRGS